MVLYERMDKAALRVQQRFRGMKGRQTVLATRRQQLRSEEQQRDREEERRGARRRVLRPALRATHGF